MKQLPQRCFSWKRRWAGDVCEILWLWKKDFKQLQLWQLWHLWTLFCVHVSFFQVGLQWNHSKIYLRCFVRTWISHGSYRIWWALLPSNGWIGLAKNLAIEGRWLDILHQQLWEGLHGRDEDNATFTTAKKCDSCHVLLPTSVAG